MHTTHSGDTEAETILTFFPLSFRVGQHRTFCQAIHRDFYSQMQSKFYTLIELAPSLLFTIDEKKHKNVPLLSAMCFLHSIYWAAMGT